jgi:hypothetical protein
MRWKEKSLTAKMFAIGLDRRYSVHLIESVVNDLNLRLSCIL